MISIVVVSHSPALAEAAVELALQMVQGERPPLAIAAGAGDGVIGTDAAKIAEAIDSVASAEGVLVFMDLGSAVLSAELALEFVADPSTVRLTSAPFVEGLLAAVVRAAGGADLATVDAEARAALGAKVAQLGQEEAPATLAPVADAAPGERSVELTLVNPSGLHARPAAELASTAAKLQAGLTVTNVRTGAGPARADSTIALLTIGAKEGDVVRITASGPQAQEALDTVTALVEGGFGEI